MLLMPIFASQIITAAYTSDMATDSLSLEALSETRQEIDEEFRTLVIPNGTERRAWAERIEATLDERDFSAARGYLLAAPLMLNKQDSAAVLAAADAESSGSRDQRLARAALLFLPEELRASYQRSTAPPPAPELTPSEDDETETDAAETPEPEADTPRATGNAVQLSPMDEPFAQQGSFFLLGDPADLTRRSQRWLAQEQVDSLQLRLRALGLMTQDDPSPESQAVFEAASILRAAHRAGRLNDRFIRYLSSRVEDALPEDVLRAELVTAFEPVMTTEARTVEVLKAYETALQPAARERLASDMEIVARIAELTSSSGAIRLVEQARTPEDMRRARLLSESGGHRSVALARELGPDVLGLAQIGVKWSYGLVLQVMGLMALGMALVWTTLSALTQAETIRFRS
ncbi:MAG: hypothetical protein HRT80_13075 [Henriciella sp.]|nr:hypothetical protein [Henriciella sp.]